jgi:hypothetical protein
MKKIITLALLLFLFSKSFSQVKIHSHNDYAGKAPLHEAYEAKADEIEADIFLIDGKLVVAHSKKEIDTNKTLSALYLQPIADWFKQFGNRVSLDRKYTFSLMIDIKGDWDLTYSVLKNEIEKYGHIFNRSKGKRNIQVVISGNRPLHHTFHSYPNWLFFDGLPNVGYAKEDLKRVTMISDNFATYSKWKGKGEIPEADRIKLRNVIESAQKLKKPIRFWGAPDTKDAWGQLRDLGASIINTDQVKESKIYLSTN